MVRAPGISDHDIGAIAPLAQDSGLKTQDLVCDPFPVPVAESVIDGRGKTTRIMSLQSTVYGLQRRYRLLLDSFLLYTASVVVFAAADCRL